MYQVHFVILITSKPCHWGRFLMASDAMAVMGLTTLTWNTVTAIQYSVAAKWTQVAPGLIQLELQSPLLVVLVNSAQFGLDNTNWVNFFWLKFGMSDRGYYVCSKYWRYRRLGDQIDQMPLYSRAQPHTVPFSTFYLFLASHQPTPGELEDFCENEAWHQATSGRTFVTRENLEGFPAFGWALIYIHT
jgi:hypothetical protein